MFDFDVGAASRKAQQKVKASPANPANSANQTRIRTGISKISDVSSESHALAEVRRLFDQLADREHFGAEDRQRDIKPMLADPDGWLIELRRLLSTARDGETATSPPRPVRRRRSQALHARL